MAVEGHATFLSDWLSATNEIMGEIDHKITRLHQEEADQAARGRNTEGSLDHRAQRLFGEVQRHGLDQGREVLSRVRQSSSLLPMYLCLALDPRDKMEWFHRKWDQYPDTKAKWMPGVRDLMLQVRDEEYRDKVSTAPAVQAEVLPSPNKIQSKFARFVSARHGARSMVPPKDVDHFRQYYLSPRRSDSQGR
ncbi:hypothetical protein E4U52_003433 [Claviceps spartinae]|nr:hypothetical protein E4U52_003433 [Claviceps spartinae]